MRISTQQLFEQGLNGILNQQSRLADVQQQLATGLKVNQPSDDPAAAARIQQLERAVAQQQVFVDNSGRAEQRLASEESALDAASEVIRRVRELTVQAANDPVGQDGRQLIAVELRQRLDQLVTIGNSRDGDGEFIFAGAQTGTQPFNTVAGQVQYRGDSQQRELLIAPATTLRDGDPGDDVFMRVRDGNGTVRATADGGNTGGGVIIAEPGVDNAAFTGDTFTLEFTAPDAFEVTDSSGHGRRQRRLRAGRVDRVCRRQRRGARHAGGRRSVHDRAGAFRKHVCHHRPACHGAGVAAGQPGGADAAAPGDRGCAGPARQCRKPAAGSARVGRFAAAGHRGPAKHPGGYRPGLQELVSEIRDLDFAEAISRLQQDLTSLEAAQQSFARIQGNSLFRFI